MTPAAGNPGLDGTQIPQWRPLGGGVYAAGQPGDPDWAELRRDGLASVINLRPPGEQPEAGEADRVRDQGMGYACLPIAGGVDLDRNVVASFDKLMRELPRPVLVHCASANRVGALFALRAAWLNGASKEAALALGRAAGLASLEPRVRELLDGPSR